MLRRSVIAVTIATLLTACGGGSDPRQPEPTPTPRSYTVQELAAALPVRDDVAGAGGVDFACPEDKSRCTPPDDGEVVSVHLSLLPPGGEPETSSDASLLGDSVSVSAWRHESPSAATTSIVDSLATDKKYDGAYDVKQEGDIKTGVTPAEQGSGSLGAFQAGAWKGHFLQRRASMTFQGTSEQRLIATATVRRREVTVSVHLNVLADGRPADFGDKLARRVLGDYLERLG